MSDDFFTDAVLSAAERIGQSFRWMYQLDPADVASVVTLYAFERRRFLEVAAREQPRVFEASLRRHANAYYRRERVRALCESDRYFYDPEYVRAFLPYFFAVEDWSNGPVSDDPSSEWATGEAIDTALDIKRGWAGLKGWQRAVIEARHLTCRPTTRGSVDWESIAYVTGRANAQSARTAYAEATRELAFEMNVCRAERLRAHEGPGARRAVSNATARARFRDQ